MDKVGYSYGRLSQQQYYHQAYRQDANTLCVEEAGMFLNLRDIAAGARKFSWDRMFQDAILRHRSKCLANSFSQS